ncbi:MAG: hypothetical protein WCJ42_02570 [Actinomycetes bacterium]
MGRLGRPASYVEKLITAIVGIEIAITEVTVKFKLSQNKDTADYAKGNGD